MKVFMLKSSMASGKAVVAGKEVEVSDPDGRVLIAYGKAIDAKDKDAVAEAKKAMKSAEQVEATK